MIVTRGINSRIGRRGQLLGSGAAGFTGLLDRFPGAAAAYSLRRLSASTTNVVRVRRSGNNAEADFTPEQIADGTLLTWVGTDGTDNGFATTLYDQENSNDATQTVATNQPKIVDAGALVTEGGKPALSFDGIDDFLEASFGQEYTQPLTYFTAFKFTDGNRIFSTGGSYASDQRVLLYANFGGAFTPFSGTTNARTGYGTTAFNLITLLFNSPNSKWWSDGIFRVEADSGSNSTVGISIGADNDGSFGGELRHSELIFYPSDQSANRESIESNINAHYGIF